MLGEMEGEKQALFRSQVAGTASPKLIVEEEEAEQAEGEPEAAASALEGVVSRERFW